MARGPRRSPEGLAEAGCAKGAAAEGSWGSGEMLTDLRGDQAVERGLAGTQGVGAATRPGP